MLNRIRKCFFIRKMMKHYRQLRGGVGPHDRQDCEMMLEGFEICEGCEFGDNVHPWSTITAHMIVYEDYQFESGDYAGA